jgi:predicted O-methyltransferase YrrM
MNTDFEFTNDWFGYVRPIWKDLIPQIKPQRILEIGSYEGASACFLINELGGKIPLELHCVDTWQGGVEHEQINMAAVERRFLSNTHLAAAGSANPVDLVVHKGLSELILARLLTEGKAGYFDFVYVDGSHQAPDVICDAILGFKLLRVGGVMAFDDYLWAENLPTGIDPIRCPKPAIDAFTNLYCRKVRILQAPLYQLYVQKVAD